MPRAVRGLATLASANRQMFTVEGSATGPGAAVTAATGQADRRPWPRAAEDVATVARRRASAAIVCINEPVSSFD